MKTSVSARAEQGTNWGSTLLGTFFVFGFIYVLFFVLDK